jgi:hypothetical protein
MDRDTQFVERLRFFDGQQLFASDLQGIEASDRELRWLHNRSLHQPGVGNGYAVAGRKGDREVVIQEGYALNADGAEIVLHKPQVEQVPPVSGEPDGGPAYFDLTVSYPSDDDLEEAETREGVCLPRGVVRLRERPVFCWVRLRLDANRTLRAVNDRHALEIQTGMKIVLARAEVLNCRLNADITIALRRRARPPRQPVIRCQTQAVDWDFWDYQREVRPDGIPEGPTEVERVFLGFKKLIDTTAAGFRVTPCYSARITGERPLVVTLPDESPFLLLDGPAYIDQPTPASFSCHVPAVVLFGQMRFDDAVTDQVRKRWALTWLGIED